MIKPEEIRVIEGEGMPEFKRPFEKGHLFIHFDLVFPPSNWTGPTTIKQLEQILPPRINMELDKGLSGALVEEVPLKKLEASHKNRTGRAGREAYEEDDAEERQRGDFQCHQQ